MEVTDFIVEDLLDLPNGDDIMNDTFLDNSCGLAGNSTDSSTVTAVDSCNSSVSGADHNLSPTDFLCRSFADAKFSNELCFPYDDTAELEWLSKFVEESFSNEDLNHTHHNNRAPAFHLTTTTASNPQPGLSAPPQFRPNNTHHHYPPPPHLLHPDVTSVPGKARSKISRVAPSDWSTRLLMVSSPPLTTATSNSSSETTTTNDGGDTPNPIPHHKRHGKKRETGQGVSATNCNGNGANGVEPLRRCLHCAAEKTPQWRTGPMGPKTLCNACGVRYKSGRLVPEYRPAASPTFVPTKHSNSHRKVLELRRQRDHHVQRSYAGHQHMVQTAQQQFMGQNGGVYGLTGSVAGGGGMVASDQYLIHHHMGPGADHYRQMI